MWEKMRLETTSEELIARTNLLEELGRTVASRARELGLMEESNCREVCKESLEIVDGRLQRVVECRIVCGP